MFQKVLAATVVMALLTSVARAEESSEVSLERIVVTPYRYSESLSNTPASVSVIDKEEIAQSGALTTVDLLSDLPGVVVRDWTGNGSKATVDMRGFGEQAGMNVLVLVNGRRVNEIDLSGTSWAQIPLD
ncbi:MAG: TonB-dependent receptor plug domain-containing protein, partial [Candidatus Omnitrophota bacterium]